jgi:hypothetical protein
MKYKIEFKSAWQSPEYFETNSEIDCNDIVLEGHRQQYLVYVNGEKQASTVYRINDKLWNKEQGYI